jgi:hypothetical protein
MYIYLSDIVACSCGAVALIVSVKKGLCPVTASAVLNMKLSPPSPYFPFVKD